MRGPPVFALLLLATTSCRGEKFLRGVVLDYDTNAPIEAAHVRVAQTGWGISQGGPVWDKTYTSEVTTDADGHFTLRYTVGSSANMLVEKPGYNQYYWWAEPNTNLTLRLRRLVHVDSALREGIMRIGRTRSAGPYGWSFADSSIATSCEHGDIIPSSIPSDNESPIVLQACGRGGIHFVSAESLKVDNLFMVYADSVPDPVYARSATLDFHGKGGVFFVRTRDGRHFAKFEFRTNGIASMSSADIVRDLMLNYVYAPSGKRRLPFNVAPPQTNRT
jgi:hypothetical protein